MENTTGNQSVNTGIQQTLPNSSAVLVLGILSIVLCWCIGIVGLTLGIIALVLSNKAKTLYNQNPGLYSIGSYKNMNAGRICAIIGTSISAAYLLFAIIKWVVIGGALVALFSQFPWESL